MLYKISQNTELWEEMDKTEQRHFVECAPTDIRSEVVMRITWIFMIKLFKGGALVLASIILSVMTRAFGGVRTGWVSVWIK